MIYNWVKEESVKVEFEKLIDKKLQIIWKYNHFKNRTEKCKCNWDIQPTELQTTIRKRKGLQNCATNYRSNTKERQNDDLRRLEYKSQQSSKLDLKVKFNENFLMKTENWCQIPVSPFNHRDQHKYTFNNNVGDISMTDYILQITD